MQSNIIIGSNGSQSVLREMNGIFFIKNLNADKSSIRKTAPFLLGDVVHHAMGYTSHYLHACENCEI